MYGKCWSLVPKVRKRCTVSLSVISFLDSRFCKASGTVESGEFLLLKSKILRFEVRNTAQGIRNPIRDGNPESTFHWHSTWNPKSMAWNPESKNPALTDPYMGWSFTNELQTHFRSLDRSCIYWAPRQHHRIGQREARKAREVNFFRISVKRSVLLRSIASWLCKEMWLWCLL